MEDKKTITVDKAKLAVRKDWTGFEVDMPCGKFQFIFPLPADVAQALEACATVHNSILEIAKAKQEEDKAKKEEAKEIKTEEVIPEVKTKD